MTNKVEFFIFYFFYGFLFCSESDVQRFLNNRCKSLKFSETSSDCKNRGENGLLSLFFKISSTMSLF